MDHHGGHMRSSISNLFVSGQHSNARQGKPPIAMQLPYCWYVYAVSFGANAARGTVCSDGKCSKIARVIVSQQTRRTPERLLRVVRNVSGPKTERVWRQYRSHGSCRFLSNSVRPLPYSTLLEADSPSDKKHSEWEQKLSYV